jgi:hypothetical protein
MHWHELEIKKGRLSHVGSLHKLWADLCILQSNTRLGNHWQTRKKHWIPSHGPPTAMNNLASSNFGQVALNAKGNTLYNMDMQISRG